MPGMADLYNRASAEIANLGRAAAAGRA